MEAVAQNTSGTVGEVKHLDHFAIPAVNLERAEKFYTEVLGLRVIVKGDPPVPGRGMFLKIGRRHHLGLFEPLQTKAIMPKRNTVHSYPRVAFALSAEEFAKRAAKVRQACSVVEEISEDGIPGIETAKRGIGFIDSEGNIMEIFQGNDSNSMAVSHLHFDTISLSDAIDFYSDVLNLKLISKADRKAVLSIPTGQALVLHEVDELCDVTKTYFDERHFAFSVSDDDFHAIVRKLHQKGMREADELGGGVNRKPGDLGTYFKDPTNGIYLQLLNRDSKVFSQKFGFVIEEG